ncbi:hypothetical protein G6F22_020763 [Rhizopus arrhizus]|nr:hypothetical protein G6F22_020763 [Rhizopus arrhizus]
MVREGRRLTNALTSAAGSFHQPPPSACSSAALALTVQQAQMADAAGLVAALRDALGLGRAAPGVVIGLVGLTVRLHGAQGVGHLPETVPHRLPVRSGREVGRAHV